MLHYLEYKPGSVHLFSLFISSNVPVFSLALLLSTKFPLVVTCPIFAFDQLFFVIIIYTYMRVYFLCSENILLDYRYTVLSRHSSHEPPDDGYRYNIRNVGYEQNVHMADCSRIIFFLRRRNGFVSATNNVIKTEAFCSEDQL
jgi:hypothetical protein